MKKLFIALLLLSCLVSKAQYEKDTIYRDTVPCFIWEYYINTDTDKYFLAYKLYWIYVIDHVPYSLISYRTKDSTGAYKYYNPLHTMQSIDLERPKYYSQFNKNYKPNKIH